MNHSPDASFGWHQVGMYLHHLSSFPGVARTLPAKLSSDGVAGVRLRNGSSA
ncbi:MULTISPECIES: hypothetical protein [Pseudomonas]|uniref:Uncharacterized protein n=1 Tax=Pseudomonas psychrophila TaxID=122355 RepID=A0A8I1FNJ9_9PSED|nr:MULTISPECIES: hypothetical protein [Pseudomonas]EPJ93390.1 hypothetical protein CF149_12189 [Pseudomonas psychrophila]MBJ2257751.1 hypothetical protein [Pseudomonas psychrophila]MDY7582514.1 hypothetical protein [Pseudomonas sp. CCI3.1]MEB0070057.1 hypothetical protein [Pseudomonas sp. CCI3.1]MEB0074132.1 hypothetical protein [Pseudomonas sp. CCI1.4]